MATPQTTFTLNLVTPESLISTATVEMVVIPGTRGDFAILPGHESIISIMRPGLLEVYTGKEIKENIFVGGGFAQHSDDICMILSEEIVPVSEIDLQDLEGFMERTRKDVVVARTQEERKNLEGDLQITRTMDKN